MSNYWNEPSICSGCTREDCKGYPSDCEAEAMEAEGDRKCHERREEP